MISVDYEAAIKVVSSVSLLIGEERGMDFSRDCEKLIDASDLPGLIDKILEQQDVIFNSGLDSDTEAIFQSLALFLFKEDDKVQGVVSSICTALTSSKDDKSRMRLKILVSLFNLLVFPTVKISVLMSLLKYAQETGLSSLVSHFHERIDGWAASWKLSSAEKRELFTLMADVLERDNNSSASLQFLVKFMDTYAGETFPTEVQTVATTAVVKAIKAPVGAFKYRAVLQESLAMLELGSAALTDLVALLNILCEGTLTDYTTYAKQHGATMQKHDIDPEVVLHNMRLLTLCSICSETRSLTYERVVKELGVAQDEAEMYIVTAVGEGLMEATMNQAMETVTVTSATSRRFGKQQWIGLRDKLKLWHSQMTELMQTAAD